MNAELPPFKNGEHNSESASTVDRVITPLTSLNNKVNTLYSVFLNQRTVAESLPPTHGVGAPRTHSTISHLP